MASACTRKLLATSQPLVFDWFLPITDLVLLVPVQAGKGVREELSGMVVLVLLYMMQGVPLGLTMGAM